MAQIFNKLTRQENKDYDDLYEEGSTTYSSLIFDPSENIIITHGHDYFVPRVASYMYSHNDPNAPFLNDNIDINNNATVFDGKYTTYAMYINPAGEITVVDYLYYTAHKA